MKIRWCSVLAVAVTCGRAWAVPVEIRAAGTTAGEHPGFPLKAAADGLNGPGQGWRVPAGAAGGEHTAVFLPAEPVSARQLLLQLFFPGPAADDYFGKFGVDVTTDPVPAAEGRWMPLILEPATAADPSVAMGAQPVVVLDRRRAPFILTIRARAPFDGITGFRLRLFPDGSADFPAGLGRGLEGGFLLGEFRVEADAPRSTNLALGRQVYCSRQVQAGLPSRNLTDGFHSTWSQPERNSKHPDAFFQMDLGQATALNHVVVRWHEGADPAQLPWGYQVELRTDSGGQDGGNLWQAQRGAERILNADVIRAGDGSGDFTGRSLLIQVKGGPGDQPQIAEIEVYPSLRPEARQWLADGRAVEGGPDVRIPAGTESLSFVAAGAPAVAVEGVAGCRWKLEGWSGAWREASWGGPVRIQPVPPPGDYQLIIEARHSDGVWDTSGIPLTLRVAAPWWSHVPSLLAALSGTVMAVGAGGWFFVGRRLRRRLARTEQHLALHRDRLRISRDMHDEIGARLTSIAMLAERTKRQPQEHPRLLTDLADQARTTVEALDTIVWAVNPTHDTTGGLADYLSDYVPDYLAPAGMACELDFRVTTPGRPLALAVRHNLLMAVKEALRNVVKHSGAARCRVVLTDAGRRLEIAVEDDGRGFGDTGAGISHTGMKSMQQRLTESGGTCVFDHRPQGGGAGVRLSVPLTDFKTNPPP